MTICDEKGSTGPCHSVPMSNNPDDAIAGLVAMYSHLLRQLEGHRVVYRADIEMVIRESKVGDVDLSEGKIASATSSHMYMYKAKVVVGRSKYGTTLSFPKLEAMKAVGMRG